VGALLYNFLGLHLTVSIEAAEGPVLTIFDAECWFNNDSSCGSIVSEKIAVLIHFTEARDLTI
jgi:hypothetical protein